MDIKKDEKRKKNTSSKQTWLYSYYFICVSFHLCHSWIHTIYNTLDQNSTYVLVNSWTFRTRSQIVWYTCCTALVKSLKNPHSKSGQRKPTQEKPHKNNNRKNHRMWVWKHSQSSNSSVEVKKREHNLTRKTTNNQTPDINVSTNTS